MDRREIDLRLQQYTAAEHRIASNLHELELHSVYQLLRNDELLGATARALEPALNASPSLWELFGALERTLSTARAIRGEEGITGRNREELGRLLAGRSITFGRDEVPFAQRGLTADATHELRMTVDEVIERMRSVYEPLRDGVARADEVLRKVLPRLDSVAQSIDGLRDTAQTLGLPAHAIDRLERSLSDARDRCTTDPLSITDRQVGALDAELNAIRSSIAEARTSHDSLITDLVTAGELLDECRRLREQAEQSRAESESKIVNPIGMRATPARTVIDGAGGLRDRLKPIVAMTGPWQQTRRDLDEWNAVAGRLRDQLARVEAANRRPMDLRGELRGRLTAFRAKMAAVGRQSDPVLAELAAEAHNELFTAPTDLTRADRLVGELGRRLAGATR